MGINALLLLVIWNPAAWGARSRWNPSERHLAALEIHRLSLGLTPLLQEKKVRFDHVEQFLRESVNPDTPIDARRGGEMLFLDAMANPKAMTHTLAMLNEANIGGTKRELQPYEIFGVRTEMGLKAMQDAMDRHGPYVNKQLRSSPAARLQAFLPGWWKRLTLGRQLRAYRNALYDGGRFAEFNGSELVDLSGGRPVPEAHYDAGLGPSRSNFTLLRTAHLVDPEEAHQMSTMLRMGYRNQEWAWTLHADGAITPEGGGFNSIAELARTIITRLKLLGARIENCSWSCRLCYRERPLAKGYDYLHQNSSVMTVITTFFGPGAYYIDGSVVHEAPAGDALALTPTVLHMDPHYTVQPSLFLRMETDAH